jgi:peptidoglycan/xylan/chitin deacetylase (PgdA/CDA1 family)
MFRAERLDGAVDSNRKRASSEVLERIKSTILIPNGTMVGRFDTPGVIGLTFDDGPDLEVTPQILEALRRHGAKATFFVLTDYAVARRELLAQVLAEGHEIGLHFDRHDRITALSPLSALRRMAKAKRTLAAIAGPVSLFRPPYGGQNYLTYFIARLLGLKVIGWTRWANDWLEQSAEHAARTASEHLVGGDIVLMHDGLELDPGQPRPTFDRSQMVDLFLSEATARGLKAVTVGSLLGRGSPRRSHWFR